MNKEKPYFHVLRDEKLRRQIELWWARLQGDEARLRQLAEQGEAFILPRGLRAELRRCHSVDDVLLTEGFRRLWTQLSERQRSRPWSMLAWATVAAVLADVRTDAPESFAAALGAQKEHTGKPYLSELRFAQLQKSDSPDSFLRRMRRAAALIRHQANVLSLADSILHWYQERYGAKDKRPENHLAVRWATDYFTTLATYQR